MSRLSIDPQPGFEAYISNSGDYVIVSECIVCGDESTFAFPPQVWNQIKSFFESQETGGKE